MISGKDLHEVPDLLLAGDRIREGQVGLDAVVVASAATRAYDVSGGDELGDDAMRGTLCDPNRRTDLAQTDTGVVRDAEKHLRMVRKKRPSRSAILSHDARIPFLASNTMYSRSGHREKADPMVYFQCSTCRIRLYNGGSPARSVGDLCPSCGSLLEPVGEFSGVGGFRSIRSRARRVPGTHQRIADRIDDLLSRRRATVGRTRDDIGRWLDDGGSSRDRPAACSRSEAKL